MGTKAAERCGVCRCYMDDQDLFCANCGTENPLGNEAALKLEHTASHHSFECKSCGASMSYDASAGTLRCPFCGSSRMKKKAEGVTIRPAGVVPFSVTQSSAESILRNWLGTGFWRPSDAARESKIGEITQVYVPYWVFEASTDTRWTADSSPAPYGSRGDWYPVGGRNHSQYNDILIGGSSILTTTETSSISPFNISDAVPPGHVDLENVITEDFRIPRSLARPQARGAIEQLEREVCAKQVPNRARNVKANVQISSMRGSPMLLPVWILAYHYKQNLHRVLINGQTGKISGSAPFSFGRLTALLLIVGAVVLALVVMAWLVSRMQ